MEKLEFMPNGATKKKLIDFVKNIHGNTPIKIDGKRVEVLYISDEGVLHIHSNKEVFLNITTNTKG